MYDMHVHSTFSRDGKSELFEYAKLLQNGNINGIGITEHVDFLPECGSYGFFDYDKFTITVEQYKSTGHEFYAGAEIDYASCVEDSIKNHLNKHKYEYVIASVHMIKGLAISNKVDIFSISRDMLRDIIVLYYKEVQKSIKMDKFDVIGHIGVYKRYFTTDFFQRSGMLSLIMEMEENVVMDCIYSSKIVEVNTSGLFSPVGTTIPQPDFLKRYYDLGGRQVCLGSDAHCIKHVTRGFDIALAMLKDIGFQYVILPWNKQKVML